MTDKTSIEIFSVEDNKVLRFALKSFLKTIPDFNLCGEAETGLGAIDLIKQLQPEIVLVDIGLPDLDGIEVTRRIKKINSQTRVLMLTASDHSDDIFDSLEAGADGYVLKGDSSANLEMAIRSVKIGAVWLDPAIARMVLVSTKKAAETISESETNSQEVAEDSTSEVLERLDQVAASNCKDGICLVDPGFMARLREINKQSEHDAASISAH